MALTHPQQKMFRILVAKAWQSHCNANAVTLRDRTVKEAWYRAELAELGLTSTSKCDPRRGFERLMAHFESLVGDSIHWQMQVFRGDAKRILYTINEIATGHDIDEDYMRSIARQALRLDHGPLLHELSADDLTIILRALRIYIRRRLRRDDPSLTPGPAAPDWAQPLHASAPVSDNCPF